jgi:hypothetical protein
MKGKPPMPMIAEPTAPVPGPQTGVEVVFLYDDAVVPRSGRLVSHQGSTFEIELDLEPPAFDRDRRVVLSFRGERIRRQPARLVSQRERRLTFEARGRVHGEEKRRFPRLVAAIGLRWRGITSTDAAAVTVWHEPDPFMSFSVTGLAFGGRVGQVVAGERITVDFQVGGVGPRHVGTARVIRVAERSPADRHGDEDHEIAVEFERIPAEAREALAELTLRIQRALTDEG